jgi:hypothetical protein
MKNKRIESANPLEYRKIQALVGSASFSVVLPKQFALNMGINGGDFVKVRQSGNSIIIERA